MEKLRELLNEFDPYIQKDWEHRDNLWYGVICWESAIFTKEIWIQKIISKEYEFIKRLIKKKKISLLRLTCMNPKYTAILDSDFSWEDEIIMILSIQDEPIQFLIDILA